MSYICGIHSPGDTHGLAAILAAFGRTAHGGEWAAAGGGLGFRYLPDAPGADALYFDHEADLAAVADVRLDDHEGLCHALGVHRSERAVLADGDLVLRGYRRWGRDLPNHLPGDYAFAVWDAGKRILFCVRDPAGVKPCYYAATRRGFAFASTVDAVLAAPGVSDAFDEDIVARSLTRAGLGSADRTFFKDVRKLPPGHSLTLAIDASSSPAVPRLERYWQPEHAPASGRNVDRASSTCARRSYGTWATTLSRRASKAGPRAARSMASNTATRCWIAACCNSYWACRRSNSCAAGGTAG